jgi:hypothetical protein
MAGPFRFYLLPYLFTPDLLGIFWLRIILATTRFLLLGRLRFLCIDGGSGRGSFQRLLGQRISLLLEIVDV